MSGMTGDARRNFVCRPFGAISRERAMGKENIQGLFFSRLNQNGHFLLRHGFAIQEIHATDSSLGVDPLAFDEFGFSDSFQRIGLDVAGLGVGVARNRSLIDRFDMHPANQFLLPMGYFATMSVHCIWPFRLCVSIAPAAWANAASQCVPRTLSAVSGSFSSVAKIVS